MFEGRSEGQFEQIEHDHIRYIRNRKAYTDTAICCGDLMVAPLWVDQVTNLGSLARTCDAVDVCFAVPNHGVAMHSYMRGNTLGRKDFKPDSVRKRVHTHMVGPDSGFYPSHTPVEWLEARSNEGYYILAAELAEGSTKLANLKKPSQPTILLLGAEKDGIPKQAWPYVNEVVEIPMHGAGLSLNVAVTGSLILYKLRGLV